MIHEHQWRIAALCSTDRQQRRRHVVSEMDSRYMHGALPAHTGKSKQYCLLKSTDRATVCVPVLGRFAAFPGLPPRS